MRELDVYTTDANPRHVDSINGEPRSPDDWVNQLARVSTAPVDLFVDVPAQRVVWTFKAKQANNGRVNRYLADYRHDPSSGNPLFKGLYTALRDLSTSGSWTFPGEQAPRWTAGFDLVETQPTLPGLDDQGADALINLIEEDTDQLVTGMASYPAALQVVKALASWGVDGRIAVNSEGATAETAGVDLVLWPEAETDFQPVNNTTMELFSRTGVRSRDTMTVADVTPSESVTTVKSRYGDKSPIETFVGDTSGRIGALLTVFVGAASIGALANVGPIHPLSGISVLGGLIGAIAGLGVVQGTRWLTNNGVPLPGLDATGHAGPPSSLDASAWNWQQYSAYAGYWLTLGYAFPTLFRLAGWPFGPTIDLAGTVPSATRYVGGLLALTLVVYFAYAVTVDRNIEHTQNITSVLVIHALFAAGLIVTAGFACNMWYDVIGFTSGAC
jgi:hypothetical protein